MLKWISRNDAIQRLAQEMKAIKSSYSNAVSCVDFTDTVNDTDFLVCGDGYTTQSSSDDDKFDVMIGSYGFPNKQHMFVDMSLFCEMMLAVKHEQEHVRQQVVMYQKGTPENVNMAKDYVSTFHNRRYYKYNYGNMLHEIDANIQAIKDTRTYFRENFPGYDVDTDLCKIMYNRQSCSQYGWFTAEHKCFDSVDDMLSSMVRHKKDVSEYRAHFTYPKRSVNEPMDCMETYLDSSPRSFRLAWDDMSGLEQRDHVAKVVMDTYPDDVRSIHILSSRNIIDSYSDNLTEDEFGGISYE